MKIVLRLLAEVSTKLPEMYFFGKFKACVCYFLTNFYFWPNDSPSETMKDVFYFI